MTMPLSKGSWLKGLLLAGVGVVLVVFACRAPGPTDLEDEGPGPTAEATARTDAAGAQAVPFRPVFTPYSVRPSIRNLDEVVATLERVYPPLLKDAGIGGTVGVFFYIDEEGKVQRVQVDESSGHQALDEAALRVADVLKFTPALNRNRGTPVWVSLPIAFTTDSAYKERTPLAPPRAGRTRVEVVPMPPKATVGLAAQTGVVSGTVTSLETSEPLAFVQIHIPGTRQGQLTNIDGRFLILDVPVGEHEIVAHFIGYGQTRGPVTVTAGDITKVSFDLRVREVALETLIVIGVPDTVSVFSP